MSQTVNAAQSVSTSLIRRINVTRVFHAIRLSPDISQRRLGEVTGLDKATVSVVVAQLAARGLVERTALPRTRRVGRPETGLSITRNMGVLVGVELDPRRIGIIVSTVAGEPLARRTIAGSRDIDQALDALRTTVDALVGEAGFTPDRIRGIGIGIPGLMDRSGRLALAPNLEWRDVPIRDRVAGRFTAPVHLENDTNAAAVAERLFGTCSEIDDFLYIAGHSGVGGALVLGGVLYLGAGGFAGEIGHVTVVPDGQPCGCGKRGCLETVASADAIVRRVRASGTPVDDMADVARALAAGMPAAAEAVEEAGVALGQALATMVSTINPRRVVLGGSLATISAPLLAAVTRTLAAHALPPVLAGLDFEISPLGEDAIPMGGIAIALERLLSREPRLPDSPPISEDAQAADAEADQPA